MTAVYQSDYCEFVPVTVVNFSANGSIYDVIKCSEKSNDFRLNRLYIFPMSCK